jgi:hypothetical protein
MIPPKTIKASNRIKWSGWKALGQTEQGRTSLVLALCLLLVGSCNHAFHSSMLGGSPLNLAHFSKGQLLRYAQAMQQEVAANPGHLLKLTTQDVALILAKPELARQDGQSRMWQYRTAGCVLDVYIQEDKVAHYEFRSRGDLNGKKPGSWSCLQSLYKERPIDIAKAFQEIYASSKATRTEG